MAVVTTHLKEKPPTLEEAQKLVGGYVERLTLPDGRQMLFDEDGHSKKLKPNAAASALAGQPVVGNAVVLSGPARWPNVLDDDAIDVTPKREIHLTFDMIGANKAGKTGHPQEVMKELGVTYKGATPQSIGDCWWFWFCEDVPSPLPDFLRELKDVDPKDWIR